MTCRVDQTGLVISLVVMRRRICRDRRRTGPAASGRWRWESCVHTSSRRHCTHDPCPCLLCTAVHHPCVRHFCTTVLDPCLRLFFLASFLLYTIHLYSHSPVILSLFRAVISFSLLCIIYHPCVRPLFLASFHCAPSILQVDLTNTGASCSHQ